MTKSTNTTNPFDVASDMENDVLAIADFAHALMQMCDGPNREDLCGFMRIAGAILDHAENLKTAQATLFEALNPHNKVAA